PFRSPLDPFEDLARADRLAVNAHERIDQARPRGGPFDFVRHLPEVQLGYDDRPDLFGERVDLAVGERPERARTQQPDLDPRRARLAHRLVRGARRGAVGEDPDLSVVAS